MNLMEGLLKQLDRVKELIKLYNGLPDGVGTFGSILMKDMVKRAEKSIIDNDTVGMLKVYKELESCE